MIVAIKDGRGGVAGDVDVGPAVFVVIESGDGETVVTVGSLDTRGFADVFELSVTEIAEERVWGVGEPAGTAHDCDPLPHASRTCARLRGGGEVEVNVIGDEDIELAIAVVVDEGAAGAPLFAGSGGAGLFGDVAEGAMALVVEEVVFTVGRDVEIFVTVVVVVADAGSLTPGVEADAGFCGDVCKGAVVVVVEEVAGGFVFDGFECCAVDEEDVLPAVAVVIEDSHTGAGGFDDVALGFVAAVDVADQDSGFGCDIDEPGGGWMVGSGWVGLLGT